MVNALVQCVLPHLSYDQFPMFNLNYALIFLGGNVCHYHEFATIIKIYYKIPYDKYGI